MAAGVDRSLLVLSAGTFATVLAIAAWASIGLSERVLIIASNADHLTGGDVAWIIGLAGCALLPFLAATAGLRNRLSAGMPWSGAMLSAALLTLPCIAVTIMSTFFTFAGI